MPYRYFTAGSPTMFTSPKQAWLDGFTALVDDTFYNGSDVFTIREESPFSSGSYINTDVRITTAIDNLTNTKLGDDFKMLLFHPDHASVTLGSKFYFDNNYWLCISATAIKSLVSSVMVRRCNNVLRWTNTSGSVIYEHCIIDYKIATPSNKSLSDPLLPEGTIQVISQLNSRTNQIKENQRFLFGNSSNWVCYRTYGGGLANFLNNQTTDNSSSRLVQLALGKSFVNEDTDNLTLGIADYYKNTAVVSGSPTASSIRILPAQDYILQGDTQAYTCYLMSGSSAMPNAFTFTGGSDVPAENYVLTTLGDNSFSVENVKLYTSASLLIHCVSGSSSRLYPIQLKGGW